jgi:hypothetical protein
MASTPSFTLLIEWNSILGQRTAEAPDLEPTSGPEMHTRQVESFPRVFPPEAGREKLYDCDLPSIMFALAQKRSVFKTET